MFLPLGDDVDHREFSVLGVILVALNVGVFLYMLRICFGQEDLTAAHEFILTWGLIPADLAKGEYHGLATYMFLHADFMHLLGNMFCFWAFVHTLEGSFGILRFGIYYLLWGVLAGLAHAAMHWGSEVPMIGASGAIAGMMGAYFVAFGPFTTIRTLIFLLHVWVVNVPAYVFMAIWVGMQLISIASDDGCAGGVAWYAHLGGFLAGAVTASLFGKNVKAQLVLNKSGTYELQAAPPRRETQPEDLPKQIEAPPHACPYCRTVLNEENRIAANLMRCPNPTCSRCIYLDEVPVEV
ncbi:MAG: rhomboid family intramembrane serine protease [Pirellulales bacterium]|nr:rhomboid family intramembrane serine protease [Pirellulales bacterium]